MSAHSILSQIRNAEQLLADTRRDIDDSWRIVGAMLRELRKKRGLTQAAAAALVARDAAIVQRWERGNCANVQDTQNYIKALETV
jgi:DNA-binding transcriptional regulator YiaG